MLKAYSDSNSVERPSEYLHIVCAAGYCGEGWHECFEREWHAAEAAGTFHDHARAAECH